MQFSDLRLVEPILRAVVAEGYQHPTPIQLKAIPHVLEGRDVLGRAQTGTGKTAAFALPILQRLGTPGGRRSAVRALVLSPTRELALQIHESFRAYGRHTGLRSVVVYGGVGQEPQTRALRDGADILVATPGRLLDLMEQGFVDLRDIRIFVLDEADRMLDMGFIHDIRKVVAKLPRERQTLLFSATMPDEMVQLAGSILKDPVRVEVTPQATAAETVEHSVYFVDKGNKPHLLRHFLGRTEASRVLVFTRTKHGADRVVRHLDRGGVAAEAIHSNKSQSQRQRTLANFKTGRTTVLVATDIAARGIDVDDVSHVVNFDVPNVPETYVHRIGRTGRAGATGIAVSFCDAEERADLKAIERLIRRSITLRQDHPEYPPRSAVHESRPASAGHASSHARRPFDGPRPPAHTRDERPRNAPEREERRPATHPRDERPRTQERDERPRTTHSRDERPRTHERDERPHTTHPRDERPRTHERDERRPATHPHDERPRTYERDERPRTTHPRDERPRTHERDERPRTTHSRDERPSTHERHEGPAQSRPAHNRGGRRFEGRRQRRG